MNLPFNAAELSVAALVVFGVILIAWTTLNKAPVIIAAIDSSKSHRADEQQREDDAEREAIREASARRLATIDAQANLIERQQSLLEQAQAFADRILSNEEKRDKEREDLEAQIAGLRASYEKLLPVKGEVAALHRQLAASELRAQERQDEMQAEIDKLREANQKLQAELTQVKEERDDLKNRLKKLEADKAARNGEKAQEEAKAE